MFGISRNNGVKKHFSAGKVARIWRSRAFYSAGHTSTTYSGRNGRPAVRARVVSYGSIAPHRTASRYPYGRLRPGAGAAGAARPGAAVRRGRSSWRPLGPVNPAAPAGSGTAPAHPLGRSPRSPEHPCSRRGSASASAMLAALCDRALFPQDSAKLIEVQLQRSRRRSTASALLLPGGASVPRPWSISESSGVGDTIDVIEPRDTPCQVSPHAISQFAHDP